MVSTEELVQERSRNLKKDTLIEIMQSEEQEREKIIKME